MQKRAWRVAAALILVAASLSACGKRGTLEPPRGDKQAAQTSPAPESGKSPKPHRPFILDGLL